MLYEVITNLGILPDGPLYGVAELGRMRRRQADDGHFAAAQFAAGTDADGGVGVEDIAGRAMEIADRGQSLRGVDRQGEEILGNGCPLGVGEVQAAVVVELP